MPYFEHRSYTVWRLTPNVRAMVATGPVAPPTALRHCTVWRIGPRTAADAATQQRPFRVAGDR